MYPKYFVKHYIIILVKIFAMHLLALQQVNYYVCGYLIIPIRGSSRSTNDSKSASVSARA